MKVILEKEDLDLITELKGCFLGLRACLRLHELKKLTDEDLISHVRKNCEEADKIILELKKEGI
jgi:hypothetical protein